MFSNMSSQNQSQLQIPLSTKSGSSILSRPGDNENLILVFDTETTGLPVKSWDDYEPYYTTEKWKDGNLKYTRTHMIRDDITKLPVLDNYGKPTYKYVNKPIQISNPNMFPHVVQFSYILYDRRDNKVVKLFDEIVRLSDNIVITPESQAVHHISLEQTQGQHSDGNFNRTIDDVLNEFMEDFYKANIVVAHNIRFDRNIVLAEMHRLVIQTNNKNKSERFKKYMIDYYSNNKEYCTCDYGSDECKIDAMNKIGKPYYKMPKLNILFKHLFDYDVDTKKLHNSLMDVIVCFCCFYKLRYDINILRDKNIDIKVMEFIKYLTPPICCGCYPIFQPNQQAHMDKGGCLYQYIELNENDGKHDVIIIEKSDNIQEEEKQKEQIFKIKTIKNKLLLVKRRSDRYIKNPVLKYSK